MRPANRVSSESLSVDGGGARFIVLALRDPHLLDCAEGKQDRSSNPYRVLSLWWSNLLDLIVEGANAVISFVMRSPIPWNMVVSPYNNFSMSSQFVTIPCSTSTRRACSAPRHRHLFGWIRMVSESGFWRRQRKTQKSVRADTLIYYWAYWRKKKPRLRASSRKPRKKTKSTR